MPKTLRYKLYSTLKAISTHAVEKVTILPQKIVGHNQ